MSGWLTPQTIAGVLITLVFAVIALHRPARGLWLYAILGATPSALQIGAFSGRTISQGLLLAEVLATALIFAWVVRRPPASRSRDAPFKAPLLVFAATAALSLLAAQALPDPGVERDVTFMVSVGQVMLVLWPIGIYFVAADVIDDPRWVRRLQTAILWLALPQFVLPVAPDFVRPYVAWSVTFGLFAAPMALAAALYSTSIPLRLVYIAIAAAPFARGVLGGKAFFYFYTLAACGALLGLRAPKFLVTAGGLTTGAVLVVLAAGGERMLVAPFERLIAMEREQASWGGKAGRGELAEAALSIWAEAPLIGVGPGNSYVYMLQRAPIGTSHNQYLNILVEFGILGLAVWLWFLVQACRLGVQIYRRAREPEHARFALGCVGVFAGMVGGSLTGDFMVHSVRNGGLELFSGYYLQWVLLGALVSVPRFEERAPVRVSASVRPVATLPRAATVAAPALRVWPRRVAPRSWR